MLRINSCLLRRSWWVPALGLVVAVLLSLLLFSQTARGQEPPQPLTIVLLIDTSFSMNETDPDRLRDLAADYLVDFLAANGETLGLHYRLGAAAFSDEVLSNSVEVDLVSVVDLSSIRQLTPSGFTDFGPALDYASREMPPDQSGGRKRAVVIFTDGRPERGDQPIDDIEAYFDDEIANRIAGFEEAEIEVFVVGIGDAVEDRDNWQRVLGAGRFVSIDEPHDLYRVYSTWFSSLIGLEAIGGAERLEEGRTETFVIDPFVEQAVVTAIKDDPAVMVSLQEPNGAEVPMPATQVGKSHAVYSVDDPAAGQWEVSVDGGGMDYYVWQRPPTLRLTGNVDEPSVGSRFLVTARGLSDRLNEAGEALELVLKLEREGQSSSWVMEQQSYGLYITAIDSSMISQPGEYVFTVSASIDDEPVANLVYEPLSRTFRALPALASVHINGEAITYSGQSLMFGPGEELEVVVEVTEPDLLGDDLTLTLRLPGQKQLDLSENPFAINPANGNHVYTVSVPMEQDQLAASLEVVLSGTTPFGASFNHSRTADMVPRPVPPTAEVEVTATTEVSTPEPTIQPVPTEVPDPDDSTLILGNWSFPLVVIVVAIAGFIYFKLRKNDPANDQLVEAAKRAPAPDPTLRTVLQAGEEAREGDLSSARDKATTAINDGMTQGIEEINSAQDIVSKIKEDKEKNQYNWLDPYFDRLFRHQETKAIDWPALRRYLTTEIYSQEERQQATFVRPLAQQLIKHRVWHAEKPYTAIAGAYWLLEGGLNGDLLIPLLAAEDHSDTGEIFSALAGAIESPSAASLFSVKDYSRQSGDQEGHVLEKVYLLLGTLYSSSAFTSHGAMFKQAEDAIEALEGVEKSGIKLLGTLLAKIRKTMPLDERPKNEREWEKTTKKLEQAIAITNDPSFLRLPEAAILRQRLMLWKELGEREKAFFTRDASVLEEGRVIGEIRPTLNIFTPEEDFLGIKWKKPILPITVYHLGDTEVTEGKIWAESESNEGKRLKFMKEEDFLLEFRRASGVNLSSEQNLEDSIDVKVYMTFSFVSHYPKRTTRRAREGVQPRSKPIFQRIDTRRRIMIDKPIRLAPEAVNKSRDTFIEPPFIPDKALTTDDGSLLEEYLQAAEQMSEHLYRNELGRIQLLSLRGLRRSGKSTNLNRLYESIAENRVRSANQYYLIKFDLYEWLDRIGENDRRPLEPEARLRLQTRFWAEFFNSLATTLQKHKLNLDEALRQRVRELAQGLELVSDWKMERGRFLPIMRDVANLEKEWRVLTVFDEADRFAHFADEDVYAELAWLSQETGLCVIVSHDQSDAGWFEVMEESFRIAAGNSNQKELNEWYSEFATGFAERSDVENLLAKSDLTFTELALRAVWVFTGGYLSLVQLLCRYLVDKYQYQAIDGQIACLVTVKDVKDAIYDLCYVPPNIAMLTYLFNGLSESEFGLLALLARDYTDTHTGLLHHMSFATNRDKRWQYAEPLETLLVKELGHELNDTIEGTLNSLLRKQLIERVALDGKKELPLVRWRVGWLQVFLGALPREQMKELVGELRSTADL